MQQYHDLLCDILLNGTKKTDRTNTGTISLFGTQMRFDLSKGFPILTTKKIHFKSVVYELLWFLKGDTNIKYLNDNGVKIWDEWADERGDLGPIYGKQWRSWETNRIEEHQESGDWETIDQINWAVERLKTKPDCRRIIVSAWNVAQINAMALAPCHALFQFNTRPISLEDRCELRSKMGTPANYPVADLVEDSKLMELLDNDSVPKYHLDCQLYQRSADMFLGVPFNIASYSLLTHMIAQCVNMVPGEFIWAGGDTHIYSNHVDQVGLLLSRSHRKQPQLKLNPEIKDIFGFDYKDIQLVGYDPHPAIKADVAV